MHEIKDKPKAKAADVVNMDAVTVLQSLNKGRKMYELSIAMEQLVQAIRDTGKPGKLNLELSVEPTNTEAGQVFITAKISGKLPREDEKATLFFTTKNNTLVRNNPDQMDMPFVGKDE